MFADGSVKTFSDGSQNVWKAYVDSWYPAWVSLEERRPTGTHSRLYDTTLNASWFDGLIWTPFFDAAYQAD